MNKGNIMFSKKVMEQAIKIHACNCDSCCVNTPLFQKNIEKKQKEQQKFQKELKIALKLVDDYTRLICILFGIPKKYFHT